MHGIWAHRAVRDDLDAAKAVKRYIAKTSYSEFRSSSETGGGLEFAGLGLSASSTEGEYREKQQKFREEVDDWERTIATKELLDTFGDQAVLNAWADCKRQCPQDGISSWVKVHDEKHVFLYVRWAPHPGAARNATMTGSLVRGARVDNRADARIDEDGRELDVGETAFLLERTNIDDPIVIKIDFPGEVVTEYVPKVIKPAPGKARQAERTLPKPEPKITKLRISVKTGTMESADTDALAFMLVGGAKYELNEASTNERQKGATDIHVRDVSSPITLAELRSKQIVLWHDNSDQGKKKTGAGWYCEQVTIEYQLANDNSWRHYQAFPVGWLRAKNTNFVSKELQAAR
ncbi:MAG TPA: hypothetical protein VG711_12475 [Phycisphaerales bacterium]|nr:hypothetical protein [Phycisphaerales bacterium]